MSDYCKCCSNNIEWLEVHHFIDFETIMNSKPKELADEIWEDTKNAPALNELITLIKNIQYVYQPATLGKVAIHEAGHSVMHYHFDDKLESIQIGGDIHAAGRVKFVKDIASKKKDRLPDKDVNELIMQEVGKGVLFFIAGVAAEYIYDCKKEIIPDRGGEMDINNCKNLLQAVGIDSNTEQIYEAYLAEAVKILEEKWSAVDALGKCLTERWSDEKKISIISGQDAEQIIKESLLSGFRASGREPNNR